VKSVKSVKKPFRNPIVKNHSSRARLFLKKSLTSLTTLGKQFPNRVFH
jgi:hypothetical protein